MARSEECGGSGVLLVDDDPGVLQLCSVCLRKAGLTPKTAINGRDALSLLREDPASIRLLITDVDMPFLSGTDLANLAGECGSPFLVLLMSGKFEPPEAASKGWEFLSKPFTASAFIDTVQRLLSR